jgi:hypothetical protein
MSLLLNLKRVIGGSNVNNMTELIMQSSIDYGGLIIDKIGSKLICFGSNGFVVFTKTTNWHCYSIQIYGCTFCDYI